MDLYKKNLTSQDALNIIDLTGLSYPPEFRETLKEALIDYWPKRKVPELTVINLTALDNKCTQSILKKNLKNFEDSYDLALEESSEDDDMLVRSVLDGYGKSFAVLILDGFTETERDNLTFDSRGVPIDYKADRSERMPECKKLFKEVNEAREQLRYNLVGGSPRGRRRRRSRKRIFE